MNTTSSPGRGAPRAASEERLADRLAAAHRYFREHHAGATPDLAFATRVAARLTPEPLSALGWAAARLLPGVVAVAIVLGWMAARTPAAISHPAAGATIERTADHATDRTADEDPLTWFLQGRG